MCKKISQKTGFWGGIRTCFKLLAYSLREFYFAPYRSALLRQSRQEEDLIQLFVYADMLGIPNPMVAYSLELQILLLENFHQWHKRMEMDRSPFEHIRCC